MATFTRGNSSDLDMTSLIGYMSVNYDKLVKLFGEPALFVGDKVQAEWILKFGDKVLTIYDWKEHVDPEFVTAWHIGGADKADLALLRSVLPNAGIRSAGY